MKLKKRTPAKANKVIKKSKTAAPKTKRNGATSKPAKAVGRATAPKRPATRDVVLTVSIKSHRDKNGGHPHIIVEDMADKHVSVGLSTKPKKGKNSPNYLLKTSPLGDGKQSYLRRQGTVDSVKNYDKPRNGKMTPKDLTQAKKYGETAKKKYLAKKDKKKQ